MVRLLRRSTLPLYPCQARNVSTFHAAAERRMQNPESTSVSIQYACHFRVLASEANNSQTATFSVSGGLDGQTQKTFPLIRRGTFPAPR